MVATLGAEVGDIAACASTLRQAGVANVIVTLGGDGALLLTVTGTDKVAGERVVHVVDTTAAGDTFTGGLAVALAEGRSLAASVAFANRAAAISVTRAGAQPSIPTRAEVE